MTNKLPDLGFTLIFLLTYEFCFAGDIVISNNSSEKAKTFGNAISDKNGIFKFEVKSGKKILTLKRYLSLSH